MARAVNIDGDVAIGEGRPLALLGGPCVVEGEAFTVELAEAIRDECARRQVGYVFKASFDKANRSSAESVRGPGFDAGLAVLGSVKQSVGVPVITDVHESWQIGPVADVADVLQIPAFLCRQTDLLMAAAGAGRAVNVKKGQFLSPPEMANVVHKLEAGGTDRILLTERGTTFGYNNLVVDFRSLPQMAALGYPVVFDATHSVQMPGGAGTASSGQREYIPHLARAAVAVGVDALFVEIHPDPDAAPSDGPNMLRLDHIGRLLDDVLAIRAGLDR